MNLVTLIQIAGLLHLGLLAAGLMMPHIVSFSQHVTLLPVFLQRLFRVYYAFIGGIIIAFGTISCFFAEQLVQGGPLAAAMLLMMTLFWIARFVVALFVFDMTPYLTSTWRRTGYHLINVTFLYLPIVYAYAFWKGGQP